MTDPGTNTPPKRQTNETLRKDIWRACDILRRDNNVAGILQYTEHLAWLLFLRFLSAEEEKRALEAALAGEQYAYVLPQDLRWNAWASPQKLQETKAEDLISFVRGQLLPGLATLSGSPLARTVSRIFSEESAGDTVAVRNLPVCASGHNLKEVIAILNTIRLDSDDDIFTLSKVYEDLLERMGSENRTAGEFYTPRPIIRFMVEVTAPTIGETVYDPAAGSAGFLVEAYEHMKPQATTTALRETLQHHTVFGQEKLGLSALMGTMNMVLHGIVTPNITRTNTLEESMKGSVGGRHDIILTNPPFGGKEGKHIQKNFAVTANATELLFLQHILKKLKTTQNARAAMVVPEGTLFRGGAFSEVKKDLLSQFHLFAVVSLPPGTFAPYSDVKTALLFFQRPDKVAESNPQARSETWYYELPIPDGLKKFSKGSPIQDNHFAEAREMWQQWRAYLRGEADRPFPLAQSVREAWQVHHNEDGPQPPEPYTTWVETLDTLKERGYDLSARNPHQDNRVALPHPAEITASLLERSREFHSILENLHELVSNGAE